MRNFPKRIVTATDIRNCLQLVKAGELEAADLMAAIEKIEAQNYIVCHINEADGKTASINYCAEAEAGGKALVDGKNVRIENVTHEKGEGADGMEPQYERTAITLSNAIPKGAEEIRILSARTVYGDLGMTEDELKKVKEELANE